MMHCYVVRDNGYALIDDTGAVVGEIIDLDRQMLGSKIKRHREPSRWFKWDVYKKLNREVGA
jgi:hypothetical protein